MGTNNVPFGEWLAGQIEHKNWTLTEFGERVGVTHSTVSRWIRGQRQPRPEQFQRIARAFDMAPEEVMFRAGVLDQPSQSSSEYERRRALADIQRAALDGIRRIEGVHHGESAAVKFYGVVPADSVRWVQAQESDEMRPVLREHLQARSPQEFFMVEVSGNCLRDFEKPIVDGDEVLLEWANGREPRNGALALVRIGDEFTLKVWRRDGDWVELMDGSGIVVHRFSILSEYEVVGLFVRRSG